MTFSKFVVHAQEPKDRPFGFAEHGAQAVLAMRLLQFGREEPHHFSVEFRVERQAIEAGRIAANCRRSLGQALPAGRQEIVVTGVGDNMIFGRPR